MRFGDGVFPSVHFDRVSGDWRQLILQNRQIRLLDNGFFSCERATGAEISTQASGELRMFPLTLLSLISSAV